MMIIRTRNKRRNNRRRNKTTIRKYSGGSQVISEKCKDAFENFVNRLHDIKRLHELKNAYQAAAHAIAISGSGHVKAVKQENNYYIKIKWLGVKDKYYEDQNTHKFELISYYNDRIKDETKFTPYEYFTREFRNYEIRSYKEDTYSGYHFLGKKYVSICFYQPFDVDQYKNLIKLILLKHLILKSIMKILNIKRVVDI